MFEESSLPFLSDLNQVERSLDEQLHIDDRVIQDRKKMLNFTREDEKNLAALQPVVIDNVDQIVFNHYEQILQSQEVSQLINDADTLQRVNAAMRVYVIELFDGQYDVEYANKRLRLGKVHHRVGVPPDLYVAGVVTLQKSISEVIFSGIPDNIDHDDLRSALTKLFMFDMQLVFDTYISSLLTEEYSTQIELRRYSENLEKNLAERTKKIREISTRDSLTGLYNLRGFTENLRRELSLAGRIKDPLTLVCFDLNGFQVLLDERGSKEGDRILSLVGSAILKSVRNIDFGCRITDDKFRIILPRTDMEMARVVYDRVVQNFIKGNTRGVTFSAGLSQTGPGNFISMEELIKEADNQMVEAKAESREKPGHYTRPQTGKNEADCSKSTKSNLEQ